MLRVFIAAALVVAALVAVKDGRVLTRAGLVGSCSAVAAPAGQAGVWEACRAGKLEGRPDLSRHSCVSAGVRRGLEYWRCPAPVGADA
jgi:hypothetical protein